MKLKIVWAPSIKRYYVHDIEDEEYYRQGIEVPLIIERLSDLAATLKEKGWYLPEEPIHGPGWWDGAVPKKYVIQKITDDVYEVWCDRRLMDLFDELPQVGNVEIYGKFCHVRVNPRFGPDWAKFAIEKILENK